MRSNTSLKLNGRYFYWLESSRLSCIGGYRTTVVEKVARKCREPSG
ncbi:11957_t:CDS:1, partial [Funneliformis mosseae]